MTAMFGKTRITAPDGAEWAVGRRWMTRKVRRSWKWRRRTSSDLIASFPGGDWAGDSLGGAVLILVGVLIIALVLVPLLLFGIEFIVVGCVLAASLAGRVVLGRPWTVEARTLGPAGSERHLEWSVPGWRRSGKVIDAIAKDLTAGREPDPL
jgi:hypothetical protein